MTLRSLLPIASLTLTGCAGEVNVNPASHAEAREALGQIRTLLEADPQDTRALDARAQLQVRLDGLNHLVARLEPKPGYSIAFYEPRPGQIGVLEHAPSEEEALLDIVAKHLPREASSCASG